jgi:hypothetical protein
MTKTKRKTKRRVPLSNEDEWGWEDNARKDLEMGSTNAKRTLPTSNLAGARGRSNNNASRMMTSVTKRTSGKHMLEPALTDYNDDNGGGESI